MIPLDKSEAGLGEFYFINATTQGLIRQGYEQLGMKEQSRDYDMTAYDVIMTRPDEFFDVGIVKHNESEGKYQLDIHLRVKEKGQVNLSEIESWELPKRISTSRGFDEDTNSNKILIDLITESDISKPRKEPASAILVAVHVIYNHLKEYIEKR